MGSRSSERFRDDCDLSGEIAALDLQGILPKSSKGIHGASNSFSVNDLRPGGKLDPIKIATDDETKQLSIYFGPPGSSRTPYLSATTQDKTIVTLRESYDTNGLFLSSTVDKLARSFDNYTTRYLCPWVHTDRIDISWTFMEVENTLPDSNPELAPPRYLKFKTSKKEVTMSRKSIGFILEHGFWKTEQGKFHYMMMIGAIAQSVLNLVNMLVIREFFRLDSAYERFMRTEHLLEPTPEDCIRISREQFGAAQKDKFFLEHMITTSASLMNKEGIEVTDFIVPADLKNYVMANSDDKIGGLYRKEYLKGLTNTSDTFVFLGKRIHSIMGMFVDGSPQEINPAKRVQQVGDYARMSTHHRTEGYTTRDRSIYMMDMDNARGVMSNVDFLVAAKSSGRFNRDTGELHERHGGICGYNSNQNIKPLAGFPDEFRDMFLVENEKADQTGKYPLRVASMWGEMARWALSLETLKITGKTWISVLMKIPGVTGDDAEKYLREGLELMQKLSSPDLTSTKVIPWLMACIQGSMEKEENKVPLGDALPPGKYLVPDLPRVVKSPKLDDVDRNVIGYIGDKGFISYIYELDIFKLLTYGREVIENDDNLLSLFVALAIQQQYLGATDRRQLYELLNNIKPKIYTTGHNGDLISRLLALIGGTNSELSRAISTGIWDQVDVLSDAFQLVTVDEPLTPYGYGSAMGIETIADLFDSGGDYNGISKDIVLKAWNLRRVLKGMFFNAKEYLLEPTHISLDPSRCPWWFSTMITVDPTNKPAISSALDMDAYVSFVHGFVDNSHNLPAFTLVPNQIINLIDAAPIDKLAVYMARSLISSLTLIPNVDTRRSNTRVFIGNGVIELKNDVVGEVADIRLGDRPQLISSDWIDRWINIIRQIISKSPAFMAYVLKTGGSNSNLAVRIPTPGDFNRAANVNTTTVDVGGSGHASSSSGVTANTIFPNEEALGVERQKLIDDFTQESKEKHWEKNFRVFLKASNYYSAASATSSVDAGKGWSQRRGNSIGDLINDMLIKYTNGAMNPINAESVQKIGRVLDFITDSLVSKEIMQLTTRVLTSAESYKSTIPGADKPYVSTDKLEVITNSRLVIYPDSFSNFYQAHNRSSDTRKRLLEAQLVLTPMDLATQSGRVYNDDRGRDSNHKDTQKTIASFAHARARLEDAAFKSSRSGKHSVKNYMLSGVRAVPPGDPRGRKRKGVATGSTGYISQPLDEGEEEEYTRNFNASLSDNLNRQHIIDEQRKNLELFRNQNRAFQGDQRMFDGPDAPMTVSYGQNSVHGLALNKNLAENYTSVNNEADHSLRISMGLFLFSAITDKCFEKWCKNDVLVPVDLLLMRPHMRYLMMSAIACKGGNELGHVIYANESFEAGDEVKTKTHVGHYSFYVGILMKSARMFMIWWNIKACKYISGEGVNFWTPESWQYNRTNAGSTNLKPSIFVSMNPYGSLNREPYFQKSTGSGKKDVYQPGMVKLHHSILGYWRQASFVGLAGVSAQVFPHYPSAIYTERCFEFARLNESSSGKPKYSYNPTFNEVVFQTYQRVCDSKTGEHNKYITSQGVFPNYMYEDGGKAYRLGEVTGTRFEIEKRWATENAVLVKVVD